MHTVESLIADTIRKEGSAFTNDPTDAGGPTKYGITLSTLSAAWGRACTAEDVAALTLDDVVKIYRQVFLFDTKVCHWPVQLQPLGFDLYVQHSPGGVGLIVQTVLIDAGFPVKPDHTVGSKTIAALGAALGEMGGLLIDALCDERAIYYQDIVRRRPSQAKYIDGWLKRCASFRTTKPDWLPARFAWPIGSAPDGPKAGPIKPPVARAVPIPVSRPTAEIVAAIAPLAAPLWQRVLAAIVAAITALGAGVTTGVVDHNAAAPVQQLESREP